MKLGQMSKDKILKGIRDFGASEEESNSIFSDVLKKKKSFFLKLVAWGIVCCVLGVVVSAAMMSTGAYEYFLWYGIILLGITLSITGIVLLLRYGLLKRSE
jgi:hypothetical protein